MSSTADGSNQNVNNNANINSNMNRIYSTPTTIKLLKALFENENYYFTSFSSKDHGKLIKKTIENSQQQDIIKPVQITSDPLLNAFVNYLHTKF
jgi:hypothetical protein